MKQSILIPCDSLSLDLIMNNSLICIGQSKSVEKVITILSELVTKSIINADLFCNWLYGDDAKLIKILLVDTYLKPILNELNSNPDKVIEKYICLEKPYFEAEHVNLELKPFYYRVDVIDGHLLDLIKSGSHPIPTSAIDILCDYAEHNIEYYGKGRISKFYKHFMNSIK